jgi:hypothetical protein
MAESISSGNKSKNTFLALSLVMFLLCAIIVGIVIAIRKKSNFFCRKKDNKKNLMYSETTESLNVQLPNEENMFAPFNDSAKLQTEVQHEIYEDITLLDIHEEKKLNDYIDDPVDKNYYFCIKVTNKSPELEPSMNENSKSNDNYYKVPLNNKPI